SNSETNGWSDPLTIVMLVVSAVLIAAFVVIQRRVAHPLLPMRVVLDRNRGGSYLAFGIVSIGMFGVFLFLTYYMQRTLDFSPVQTGLAFLAMNFAIMASIGVCSQLLLPRFGPRPLISGGMALAAVAMIIFAQLETTSGYVTGVLPGLLVMGIGMGGVFSAAMASATLGVDPHDAGVASAMVNTTQQVGGSIGTALLSTLFASAVTSYSTNNADRFQGAQLALESTMHGYVTAFWIASGILAFGAVVTGLLLRPGAAPAMDPSAEPVMAH
ncbi:MAG: MFS transporter, partial [Patulibacter sp.]